MSVRHLHDKLLRSHRAVGLALIEVVHKLPFVADFLNNQVKCILKDDFMYTTPPQRVVDGISASGLVYMCICQRQFTTLKWFLMHYETAHSEGPFGCQECSFQPSSFVEMAMHMTKHHVK
jgi:hypothetical protein